MAKPPPKTQTVPITPFYKSSVTDPSLELVLQTDLLSVADGVVWDWAALPVSDNRYEIGDWIASGGMGSLYAATDKVLGRRVAIKVLRGEQLSDYAAVVRFLQEARIHAQFHHPCIPPLHDVGRLEDGRPFLAMKLIRGRTLTKILGGQPAVDLDAHLGFFEKVCLAIGYAHAKGVVHRDLTPSNVLISEAGRVQVIDWGLAKVLLTPQSRSPDADARDLGEMGGTAQMVVNNLSQTAEGVAVGTPAYMSPEQASGTMPATEQSDVFGLGGVLFHLLTGQPPHQGKVSTILKRVRTGDLDDVHTRLDASGGPKAVVALAKACLSPDPDDRPKNAAVLARAVADCRATPKEPPRRSLWAKLFGPKGL
jgi:serine/threonine protein kinase